MAPLFQGEKRLFGCERCNYSFSTSEEQHPRDNRVVCPNCGIALPWAAGVEQPADRCQIKPSAVRRFDVIATRPGNFEWSGRIKRVVGLPCDRLAFIDGNLFNHGEVTRKSYREFTEGQIHVFTLSPGTLSRMVANEPDGCWRVVNGRWQFAVDDPAEASHINYRHERCVKGAEVLTSPNRGDGALSRPVDDNYDANQNLTRSFHQVDDLSYELKFILRENGALNVRFVAFGRSWTFMASHTKLELTNERDDVLWSESRSGGFRQPISIVVSFFDFQVFVDGVLVETLAASNRNPTVTTENLIRPFLSIRPVTGSGSIEELRIFRDCYFYDSRFSDGDTPDDAAWIVPDDSYFLIGDNVPRSRDSRFWHKPYVPREEVLGVVEGPGLK